MSMSTGEKLAREAKALLDQGDSLGQKREVKYRDALEKIKGAKAAGLSNYEIAEIIGRSEAWVRDLLKAGANNIRTFTPYSGKYQEQKQAAFKRTVRDADPEEVVKHVKSENLPAVAKAAAQKHREIVKAESDFEMPERTGAAPKATKKTALDNMIDIMGLGLLAQDASKKAREMIGGLQDQELDETDRDYLHHLALQAAESWSMVASQIESPVAGEIEAFLAAGGE